jgi:hypothetical protein
VTDNLSGLAVRLQVALIILRALKAAKPPKVERR